MTMVKERPQRGGEAGQTAQQPGSGGCYYSSYPNNTGIALSTTPGSCLPGFYCPAVNSSIVATYCPPSPDCVINRLLALDCTGLANAPPGSYGAQGLYEPVVCLQGNYCPTSKQILPCPNGYFCPTGTVVPLQCDFISSCPTGSANQTSYMGLVAVGILDSLIGFIFLYSWLREGGFLKKKGKRVVSDRKDAENSMEEEEGKENTTSSKEIVISKDVNEIAMEISNEIIITPPASPIQKRSRTSTYISPLESLSSVKNELAQTFRESMNGRDLRMHFEMEGLGYRLPSPGGGLVSKLGGKVVPLGKEILKGVNGRIHSGKMTAIMGPSGAGKTTFMNVLCGKVARTSGSLKISGRESKLSTFKKIVGFVPQEDVMLRELSVKENILHSARVRLPKSWNSSKVEKHVDSIIEALNLTDVADSIIGDGITRGISGGQRKRVNIAIEVAATPLCLFLDEPTSGLDSTSSLEVMDMLDKISKIGMTIVAVIHQPRVEIFRKFDDVLMIAPGGRTAYLGPTGECRPYFENLGFQFPIGSNDADVLMDILSGHGVNSKMLFEVDDLVENWAEHASLHEQVRSQSETEKSDEEFHTLAATLSNERGASFLKQVYLTHNLSLLQQYRTFSSVLLEIFTGLFSGGVIGISMNSNGGNFYNGMYLDPYELLSPAPTYWLAVQVGMLLSLAIALAAAPAGVKVFAEELPVYWRNAASGHNRLAYYLGKTLSTVYRLVLAALHFSAIFYTLSTPVMPYAQIFAMVALTFYGVYGISSFVTMLVRRENATLLSTVTSLFAAIFCGYGLSVANSRTNGTFFIFALSFNMYGVESFFSSILLAQGNVYQVDAANSGFGYTLNRIGWDYFYMFLIGCAWRAMSFVAMVSLNRSRQI